MAKLPTRDDLSQPGSLRSGRMISSADTSAIGRGLEALGSGIAALGEKQKQQQNVVDLSRAEALKTKRFLDLQNQFEQDGDYSTFGQRAGEGTRKAVEEAGNLIRDRQMREKWLAQSEVDIVRTNDTIIDRGATLRRQAETNALDEALEANRRLYVDPLIPEDVKAKARNEIIGAIDVAGQAGLLTPDQVDARKKKYVDEADFSRGELEVDRDPSIILGPQNTSAGYGDTRLPAGMRNNNPGNIKYVGQGASKGVIGPSENTDQGDPQAVFATPEAGMREAYRLARSKYDGGKSTANQLIAGDGGWTPGNTQAAANIAAAMGLGPDDDLKLDDPVHAEKFMRALVTQEHGPASKAYSDDMIRSAVTGATGAVRDFPIVTKGNSLTGRRFAPDLSGVRPEVLTRFQQLQNSFGASVPVVSGFRDPERNAKAGGAKKSRHIQGDALDLDVSNLSTEQRIDLIRKARAAGFAGIGVYPNSIHIDTGAPRAWGPSFSRNSLPEWAKEAVNAPLGVADASGATRQMPDYWTRLSPEDQAKLRKQAETRQNQINVETRAGIEVAAENAPTAILNTGKYDGQLPSLEQFQTAYGPVDGSERYGKFRAAVETSEQAYGMRTMSSADIEQLVQSSVPKSSGNDAALEQARYDALSKAAAATLKAREADPASYVRQVFPSVSQAWTSVDQPGGAQASIAASIAAQQQLGIAKVRPLPKDYADSTIAAFKDENLSEADRINSVAGVLMATADPTQQRAIFEQMVDAGLPDMTEGAFVALSRGDTGAANRLFRAALVDPAKLPGKAPETPAAIDGQIQSTLMDENQIGDLYYGLSDGSAENLVRAQRDAKLLNNAVNIRLRNGETLDAAVSGAARDLYGDVKPVTGDSRVNAQILLPAEQDEAAVLEGLAGILPQVETALTEALAVPADAPTADSTRAILDATGKNYIANVMAEGYFRNAGQGFVFIDPFTGTAVPDRNGQAMIFSLDQVEASRPLAPPMILPSDQSRTLNENVQDEMQQQEDRVRQMYEGAQ